MKFISWNVNGFRAVLKKGFEEYFAQADADFFAIQETKMQEGQADFAPQGCFSYYHSAQKKGYSGTAVFTKHEPLTISRGMRMHEDEEPLHADEGRVQTLEYTGFYFVNCYVPNAQPGLARINYRMQFEDDLRAYLLSLNQRKPVIYCGDLNVAHNEIDLINARANMGQPGFSDQERGKMTQLLDAGFSDTFRQLYPDVKDKYTWWSYIRSARASNAGWRIDYFVVSTDLADRVQAAFIEDHVLGSDHCPVGLVVDVEA